MPSLYIPSSTPLSAGALEAEAEAEAEGEGEEAAAGADTLVTESARARSYCSNRQVQKTC